MGTILTIAISAYRFLEGIPIVKKIVQILVLCFIIVFSYWVSYHQGYKTAIAERDREQEKQNLEQQIVSMKTQKNIADEGAKFIDTITPFKNRLYHLEKKNVPSITNPPSLHTIVPPLPRSEVLPEVSGACEKKYPKDTSANTGILNDSDDRLDNIIRVLNSSFTLPEGEDNNSTLSTREPPSLQEGRVLEVIETNGAICLWHKERAESLLKIIEIFNQ